MNYNIKTNEFEGPLDLLLHLIKQSQIEIYDIKIEEITNQYLNYIKQMEELNLDIASEYLVIAAELIEIKSRMLLPKQTIEDSDEYEEDPKEALINKLLEYKKYKEASDKFKELEETRSFIFTKIPANLKEYISDSIKPKLDEEIGINNLLDAFQSFLERQNLKKPLNVKITNKEITINERRKDIKNLLKTKKKINIEELFDNFNKSYIITTFLTILEMAKDNEIIIKQTNNFDPIYISLKEGVENE
ncbi:MAG: segregation/condensation protein A [Bacilli bacterium]